jgi:hypothetical protein
MLLAEFHDSSVKDYNWHSAAAGALFARATATTSENEIVARLKTLGFQVTDLAAPGSQAMNSASAIPARLGI